MGDRPFETVEPAARERDPRSSSRAPTPGLEVPAEVLARPLDVPVVEPRARRGPLRPRALRRCAPRRSDAPARDPLALRRRSESGGGYRRGRRVEGPPPTAPRAARLIWRLSGVGEPRLSGNRSHGLTEGAAHAEYFHRPYHAEMTPDSRSEKMDRFGDGHPCWLGTPMPSFRRAGRRASTGIRAGRRRSGDPRTNDGRPPAD